MHLSRQSVMYDGANFLKFRIWPNEYLWSHLQTTQPLPPPPHTHTPFFTFIRIFFFSKAGNKIHCSYTFLSYRDGIFLSINLYKISPWIRRTKSTQCDQSGIWSLHGDRKGRALSWIKDTKYNMTFSSFELKLKFLGVEWQRNNFT